MEITKNKITEIFCIIDDFCQEYDKEIARMSICEPDGSKHRNRKWTMSRSEIMTILIYFHFNTFRNFKHYYASLTFKHRLVPKKPKVSPSTYCFDANSCVFFLEYSRIACSM